MILIKRLAGLLGLLCFFFCFCFYLLSSSLLLSTTAVAQDADAETSKRGWQPLVKLLDALTPRIDTSLELTPKDITDHITQLLDEGHNQHALDAIEKRLQEREDNGEINVDVQLLFLQGRAQSQLGLHKDAIESYKQLTVFYPELPEPWNNLATEYIRLQRLDLAEEALEMALLAKPNYNLALINQGELYLLLAQQSFEQSEK